MRPPLLAPALAAVAGAAFGTGTAAGAWTAAGATALVCADLHGRAGGRTARALGCLLLAAATGLRVPASAPDGGLAAELAHSGGDAVDVEGTLLDYPLPYGDDTHRLRIRLERWRPGRRWRPLPATARLYLDGALPERGSWLDGDRVRAAAKLRVPDAFHNAGGFDARRALARRSIDLVGGIKSPHLLEPLSAGAPSWRRRLAGVRRWLHERLADGLGRAGVGAPERALVTAVVLGVRTEMAPETRRRLRVAGLYHLVAISGLHVALLVAVALAPLRAAGLRGRATAAVGLPFVVAYAAVCGARPPVVRAAAVVVTALAGRLIGRWPTAVNSLSAAALVIVVVDPTQVADAGFQLTFAAAVALATWAPRLSVSLPGPGWLRAPTAAGLAAMTGVLPLAAIHFGRIAPWGLLVGAPATAATVVAAVAGWLVAFGGGDGWLGPAAARAAGGAARVVLALAAPAQDLPLASWAVPAPRGALVAAYVVALVALATRRRRAAGWAVLAVAAGAAIVTGLGATPAPAAAVEVLDVGQGTAVVLQEPGGSCALVDGGGVPGGRLAVGEVAVLPRLRALGCERIAVAVVSHPDVDHGDGIDDVLRELPVGQLWLGGDAAQGVGARVVATARRRGVPVLRPRRGDCLAAGALALEVLHPAHDARHGSDNDRSLVLRARLPGLAVLLPGDVEAAAERHLLEREAALATDVLVVAHHGSRTSTTAPFLRAVAPRLAVVSAGRGNRWGHPHAEVEARLRAAGVVTLRTDRDGAVRIEVGVRGRRVLRCGDGFVLEEVPDLGW